MKVLHVCIWAIITLMFTGCAADSGMVVLGDDTYMISKQAATGFHGIGGIKSEAIQEAADQCRQSGKEVEIIDMDESEPPFILGNFPQIDLQFRCVDEE